MRLILPLIALAATPLLPAGAHAHSSEQGFVLLLPTAAYTAAGVAAVLLTVVAMFLVPGDDIRRLFKPRRLPGVDPGILRDLTSLGSLVVLAALIGIGLTGPRDPLSNLMSLGFWTLGWMLLVTLTGLLGNLWLWLNPWTGLFRLLGRPGVGLTLPATLGLWPATLMMLGFGAFLLADIAPEDPTRLAYLVLAYVGLTFLGMLVFGESWLDHAELGRAISAAYGKLAPVRLRRPGGIGGPGWQLVASTPPPGAGAFALTLLALGSFDGLNETYWWLARIGVNPLEFPGRSAVVEATLVGLIVSVIGLGAAFAATVWLGLRLAGQRHGLRQCLPRLALCLLPIALVYHIAHYLTAFLVSIQYTVAALSDPLGTGADWLGIQPFRVTTGFFNSIDTVRFIWMSQAALVVIGHMWSVLLGHRIALSLFEGRRRASLATLPLSAFMIAYTLLGLWLLAAPRGA